MEEGKAKKAMMALGRAGSQEPQRELGGKAKNFLYVLKSVEATEYLNSRIA